MNTTTQLKNSNWLYYSSLAHNTKVSSNVCVTVRLGTLSQGQGPHLLHILLYSCLTHPGPDMYSLNEKKWKKHLAAVEAAHRGQMWQIMQRWPHYNLTQGTGTKQELRKCLEMLLFIKEGWQLERAWIKEDVVVAGITQTLFVILK